MSSQAVTEVPGGAFGDVNLTIRDRINYPYILGNQILTIQKTLLQPEAAREVLDSIEALIHQIPDGYKDEDFAGDLQRATLEVERDVREDVIPGVKMSAAMCEQLGKPVTKIVTVRDPWMALQACINLLARLNMLTRRNYVEIRPGDEWSDEWQEVADAQAKE